MAFVHIISGAEIATIIRYLVLVKSHKKCIGIYQCHFTQKTHLLIISAVWCMHTGGSQMCSSCTAHFVLEVRKRSHCQQAADAGCVY